MAFRGVTRLSENGLAHTNIVATFGPPSAPLLTSSQQKAPDPDFKRYTFQDIPGIINMQRTARQPDRDFIYQQAVGFNHLIVVLTSLQMKLLSPDLIPLSRKPDGTLLDTAKQPEPKLQQKQPSTIIAPDTLISLADQFALVKSTHTKDAGTGLSDTACQYFDTKQFLTALEQSNKDNFIKLSNAVTPHLMTPWAA